MRAKVISLLVLLIAVLAIGLHSSAGAFSPLDSVCNDPNAANSPTCQDIASQNKKMTDPVVHIIQVAVNLIAAVAGAASIIIIIISGFQFVTAGGASPGQRSNDPNKVKSARATLSGALVGLVIIALAWTIVTFVTNHFIG
jgi:hypothetical protein